MSFKYIVEGKRWFDGMNTYHTVVITNARTGKVIYSSGFTYGYGDHWKQTALEALIRKGVLAREDMYNHEKIRKNIHFSVVDVTRRKDLDLETSHFMTKLKI